MGVPLRDGGRLEAGNHCRKDCKLLTMPTVCSRYASLRHYKSHRKHIFAIHTTCKPRYATNHFQPRLLANQRTKYTRLNNTGTSINGPTVEANAWLLPGP